MYYAVFRINGKQKWVNLQIPTKGHNKRKAEEALQNVLFEYSNNPNLANDMLFTDYLDIWLKDIKPLVKEVMKRLLMVKLNHILRIKNTS